MKNVNGIPIPDEAIELETGDARGSHYVMWAWPFSWKGEPALVIQFTWAEPVPTPAGLGMVFSKSVIERLHKELKDAD